LTARDAAQALPLLHAEGWRFDEREVRRLLRVGFALGSFEADRLEGIVFVTLYGPLAWIGNVVVRPEARGRGVAGAILKRALAEATERGVQTVRLYSVPKAVELYRRLGFVVEGRVHALYGRRAAPHGVPRAAMPAPETTAQSAPAPILDHPVEVHWGDAAKGVLSEVVRLDHEVFGASRRALFEALVEDPTFRLFVLRGDSGLLGYIGRRGEASAELGPGAVRTTGGEVAARLVDAALATHRGAVEAAVPDSNPPAVEVFVSRGFEESFVATTMRWGADAYGGHPSRVLAVGGMEKG
jgi:GNAT superfamily N-acetyltransferase